MKTHTVQQTKHQLRQKISKQVNFQITGKCMGLSVMRQSYKLKITTKTEKIEKSIKSSKCIILQCLRLFAIN